MIVFLPIGYVMSQFDCRMKLLWIIKAGRIQKLKYYWKDTYIKPIVSRQFEKLVSRALADPQMRADTSSDKIYHKQKIYIINTVKIFVLVM